MFPSLNGPALWRRRPGSNRSLLRRHATATLSGRIASTGCRSAKAAFGLKDEPMAQSFAHRWGQIIGNLLEESLRQSLQAVADRHGLYLDSHGRRPARPG